jgi:hypothetical protein
MATKKSAPVRSHLSPESKKNRRMTLGPYPTTIPKQNPKKSEKVTLEEYMASKQTTTIVKNTPSVVTSAVQTQGFNELHQRIRVCVRKRPLSKREIANQETDIAPLVGSRTIQVNEPKYEKNTQENPSRY